MMTLQHLEIPAEWYRLGFLKTSNEAAWDSITASAPLAFHPFPSREIKPLSLSEMFPSDIYPSVT